MTEILEAFKRGGDGAHRGLSDWYPEKEKALAEALASGQPFDTGWYGSKHEIASARIYSDGQAVWVEVSVSDDFDTPGSGEALAAERSLEAVSDAIERAWEEAEEDQKDNREYVGYALMLWTAKIPAWIKDDKRSRYGRKQPQCLDYLILPTGDPDLPPTGDNYSYWGWQNDYHEDNHELSGKRCVEEGIPARTVKAFEDFAHRQETGSLRIGDWEIKAWSDD